MTYGSQKIFRPRWGAARPFSTIPPPGSTTAPPTRAPTAPRNRKRRRNSRGLRKPYDHAMRKAAKKPARQEPPRILKGWKAIGEYLGVGASEAERWAAKRGMP